MYSNTCKNMITYSNKYTYNYMIILIRIHVRIPLATCKIDDALLVYIVLFEKDYYKFLVFRVNKFTI